MKYVIASVATSILLTACTTHLISSPTSSPTSSSMTSSIVNTSTASVTKIDPLFANTWPIPDDRLTPGAIVPGCTYPRPARSAAEVTNAERIKIAQAYRYTGPSGLAYLEYDHRIPYALCGLGGVGLTQNVWPEPYDGSPTSIFIHNYKDQLESFAASQVRYGRWTLAFAQDIFRGNWVVAWCTYRSHYASIGVTC
jgi:hypothetical protein